MPAYSGLWDGVYNTPYPGTTIAPNAQKRLRRALKGLGSLAQQRIVRTFITGDVGSTATKTHTRVHGQLQTPNPSLGGVRTLDTVTDINRALTADDQTTILAAIDNVHTPTWPVELSGNSGGGKLGF